MTKASTELDNPWKDIIELYFADFMRFFFPQVYKQIDWNRACEFLDKELQKVVRDAKMKRRLADKLVKVWLKNGKDALLYIHIEVQAHKEEDFPERIFIYHYRLYDRYGRRVISLAILGDSNKDWKPKSYGYKLMGCSLSFRFPIVKLTDYKDKEKMLEKSNNPFAIVVRTHLKGLETHNASKKRFDVKVELFKALHEANYSEQQILDLFRFMDWVLALPKGLEQQFNNFAKQYEDEKNMPYVTSIERIAREEGREEGRDEGLDEGRKEGIQLMLQNSREYVVDTLRLRFKRVPKSLANMIQAINDTTVLSTLHQEAILSDSLSSFKQLVEKHI